MLHMLNTWDSWTHSTHSLLLSPTPLTLLLLSVLGSGCTASQMYPYSVELCLFSGTMSYQSLGACFVLSECLWRSIDPIMYQSIPTRTQRLFSLIALFFWAAILIVIFFFASLQCFITSQLFFHWKRVAESSAMLASQFWMFENPCVLLCNFTYTVEGGPCFLLFWSKTPVFSKIIIQDNIGKGWGKIQLSKTSLVVHIKGEGEHWHQPVHTIGSTCSPSLSSHHFTVSHRL